MPKIRSSGRPGSAPRYMRAVSNDGARPRPETSATAAALGSGTSMKTGPGATGPASAASSDPATSGESAKSGPTRHPSRAIRIVP